MNTVFVAIAVLAVCAQTYSQCLPACPSAGPIYAPSCGCGPAVIAAPAPAVVAAPAPVVAAPAVIQTNSVAANLADTLSLLTVSTLLAEKLPYNCASCAPYPAYPGCGCGYGYVL